MKTTILLFAVLILASCKQDYGQVQKTKENTTQKVELLDISNSDQRRIQTVGILTSDDEVLLSFKTGGIVQFIDLEEGSKVRKGQVISRLDLTEINAQVSNAQSGYNKSKRDADRVARLFSENAATLVQKENTETALEIAKANLEIANFNKNYSVIRSPMQATVLKRFVDKGELVAPGQPVYLVGTEGSVGNQVVTVSLTDKELVLIALNDKAFVKFDPFKEKTFEGKVSRISAASNPRTGLFTVEVTLDEYHTDLRNGFIGEVHIEPAKGLKVKQIPMEAMVEGNGNQAQIFYTLSGKKAQSQQVSIVDFQDGYFTVLADELPKGAKVIGAGAAYLRNNDPIKVEP